MVSGPTTIPCPVCGADAVLRSYSGRSKWYCPGCKNMGSGRGTSIRVWRCKTCTAKVQPGKRFCSDECRPKPKPLPQIPCVVCSVPFTPHDSQSRYCSRECRARRPSHRPVEKTCCICGQRFTAPRNRTQSCSDCQQVYARQQQQQRSQQRART